MLAKGKGQAVGLNRVMKLSHMETVRFEQNLEGELVTEIPERRLLWADEIVQIPGAELCVKEQEASVAG